MIFQRLAFYLTGKDPYLRRRLTIKERWLLCGLRMELDVLVLKGLSLPVSTKDINIGRAGWSNCCNKLTKKPYMSSRQQTIYVTAGIVCQVLILMRLPNLMKCLKSFIQLADDKKPPNQ